ncbi:Acetyltransferase (isoleucine patch superfamily) [Lachnospiraceae bacterium XBB1006]|nr:Acetyltransferase (isoleucine patch superfamily) [Lachnospiraceae bacterium XBB1006]
MTAKDLVTKMEPYVNNARFIPDEIKMRAAQLCWEFNQTGPAEGEKRGSILKELFGTCTELTFVEPSFHCDYGFNIHSHGFMFMNYNCVILDTSPVHIGSGAFIAPGCVLACAGHSLDPKERAEGIGHSAPITLEDNVWLGANVTVLGGVTIGEGSMIGAGSVVTHDIPAGVIAVGNPCKVLRPVTEADRIREKMIVTEG